MRWIAIGLALLAFLAEPTLVYAQESAKEAREKAQEKKAEEANPLLRIYHEKQKENAEIEKRYQRTLRATDKSAAPTHVDPWANMRGGNATKP